MAVFITASSSAQQRKFLYDVIRDGKSIGEIIFTEVVQGQKKFLRMTSEVKTTMIFTFTDNTLETASFNKGILVSSSFQQKQTGSDDVNKSTTASGKNYKLTDNGNSKLTALPPIRYNTLLLYTNVPNNIKKVYSANYQQMVDIKKIAADKYRLLLPDNKYNDYTYKNGICTKVEIERTMGSVQFVLREQSTIAK